MLIVFFTVGSCFIAVVLMAKIIFFRFYDVDLYIVKNIAFTFLLSPVGRLSARDDIVRHG